MKKHDENRNIHYLRHDQSICWIAFHDINDSGINVLGLMGASRYIDKNMNREDARAYYKEKLKEGWHKATEDEIREEKMNWRLLKLRVYD